MSQNSIFPKNPIICVLGLGYVGLPLAVEFGKVYKTIPLDSTGMASIETDVEELESILFKIQNFDPPGVGARNLQECLELQLERKDDGSELVKISERIIQDCFNEFSKKHYDKIAKKLNIQDEGLLKEAITMITRLDPKPGGTGDDIVKTQYLIPDYLLTNNNGKLELTLNSRNAPMLKVSKSYSEMLHAYDKSDKKDACCKQIIQQDINLLANKEEFDNAIFVKVRSTGKLLDAKIDLKNHNTAEVNLKLSEDGISPGQACVFYKKDDLGYRVLGGGWIKS